jgi:hypothetical protein
VKVYLPLLRSIEAQSKFWRSNPTPAERWRARLDDRYEAEPPKTSALDIPTKSLWAEAGAALARQARQARAALTAMEARRAKRGSVAKGTGSMGDLLMRTATLRALALGTVIAALLASPAAAATRDDGPYTPFPEGDPKQRALGFIRQLNAERVTGPAAREARAIGLEELARGSTLDATALQPLDTGTTPKSELGQPKGAFARAGVSEGDGGPPGLAGPLVLLSVLLGIAALGFEFRGRRRPAHA